MDNFNEELITKVKLFHSEQEEEDYIDEKYSFLLLELLEIEGVSRDNIIICEEDYEELNVNLDGYYYDEDSNAYNLIYVLYNDENNDSSTINPIDFNREYSKIENLLNKISDKSILKDLDSSKLLYDICSEMIEKIDEKEIIVTIYSNYVIDDNLKKNGVYTFGKYNAHISTADLNDLKEKHLQLSNEANILNLVSKFGSTVPAVKIASTIDFDVYMCSFKGDWLALLYKEDGQRLLQLNVRSYLKRTKKTNAGILDTVKTSPDEFVTYNNGLTAIASAIEAESSSINGEFYSIKSIDNFQIVNGGQTTATLAECAKDKLNSELKTVVVPVKLTVIKNNNNSEMLIGNISVYSNTQTAIKKSDPPSNLKYYVDIKNISKQVILQNDRGKNYICYFERTIGEYQTELKRNNSTVSFKTKNPADKKFNKTELARSINCWQQLPYVANLGRETNFAYFNDIVKNQIITIDEEYFKKAYATIILYKKIDKICKKKQVSYKSVVVSYVLSYLSYKTNQKLDLIDIFDKQDISNELSQIISKMAELVLILVCSPPTSCPEQRMWARKPELWEKVKQLDEVFYFTDLSATSTNFFPENEPKKFIDNDNNFNNIIVWQNISTWNERKRVLNKSQQSMINSVIFYIKYQNSSMSKKQINYAKDIFMAAVKGGFDWKNIGVK